MHRPAVQAEPCSLTGMQNSMVCALIGSVLPCCRPTACLTPGVTVCCTP